MIDLDRKKHWENIYATKKIDEVSWYQPIPTTSRALIEASNIAFNAKIIDVGGGDGSLVDCLLELGYTDITVLDISANAIERAKNRLGENAEKVKWIVADAAHFNPPEQYDLWHDRAAFHFLTQKSAIQNYQQAVEKGLKENGCLIIGTFSKEGPLKCSGIAIQQYSEETLTNCFSNHFNIIKTIYYKHPTPFNTMQNFVFCSFKKTTQI